MESPAPLSTKINQCIWRQHATSKSSASFVRFACEYLDALSGICIMAQFSFLSDACSRKVLYVF